jgi:mandelate racemase
MTPDARLTIRALRARPVNVPLRRPLQTGGGLVETAPLVLIDLHTEEGLTGHSYVFCYTPLALLPAAQLIANFEALVKGDAVAPLAIEQKLRRRLRLLGPQGLTGVALAGIDMAAWDALAKAHGAPLVRLLGGEPRPIPAYNSCGLGLIGADKAGAEARELIDPGFKALKVRLGYPELEADLAAVRAVRQAAGAGASVMADYNQSLSVAEAVRRGAALDGEGLDWIEEPTLADDDAGHAQISRELRTPVQIGENWWGPREMGRSLAAGASDFVMPDVMKIGGVTGWLRAAALAEAAGLPLSSHLFPEVSAHLLAVTPTAHWLEYVDFADPILREPLRVANGHALIAEAPGIGISWDEEAVAQHLAHG